MTKAMRIKNLGCASCAAKMERQITALQGVQEARVNFFTQRLTVQANDDDMAGIVDQARRIISAIEPDACLVG